MSKRILLALLFIESIVILYLLALRPTNPSNLAITIFPTTSLEETICNKVSEQMGDCKKILLYDSNSKLIFAESSLGIVPILTNQEFTQFKNFFHTMDFQEFKEEQEDRGPIDWRVDQATQEDLSIIYGFAEDDAKTIVINSQGNVQPNRFFVRDNLWVWYAIFRGSEIELPVQLTVYNETGQQIYGENE